jgi:RNA polymerase sigma factor (sigma-70 family)
MPEMNDTSLIREYADRDSEAAFADLVHRHIHLVHSVAFRYVRNSADAQDVTQAVFVILAKKAASLRQRSTLTGWLYETTRFTAATFLRTRARQQTREQEAYMQSTVNDPDPSGVWRQLEPFLEEAMSGLNKEERELLALRFFENKTAAQTAAMLGIREGAAHKRAARALEKVRRFFSKRGIHSTTAIISGAISANSVQAAPAALAKSVTAVAMTKGVAASGSTLTLLKTTLNIMTWTKLKTAAVAGLLALLAAGSATVVIYEVNAQTNTGKASAKASPFAFAGYATPEKSLQSWIWAMSQGDLKKVEEGMTSEQLERVRQKLKDKSEDQVRSLLIAWANTMTGYQISEKQVISDDEVRLLVQVQPYPGHPNVGNDLQVMQKVGDAWKYAGKWGVDVKEN